MPIERRLCPSTKVLRTTLSGPITIDDLHEHLVAVHGMEGHRRPEMIDARAATPRFNTRDLSKLAATGHQLFGPAAPLAPRAVVVSGVIYFGMARVCAAIVAGWVSMSVFDEMTSAEAWLAQFLDRES